MSNNENEFTVTDSMRYDFFGTLFYIGSYDLYTLLKIGSECHDSAEEVAEIIYDFLVSNDYSFKQAQEIDSINVYNEHILYKADEEIKDITGYSLRDEGGLYFYSNFSDCPLCSDNDKEETKDTLIKALIENEYTDITDLNYYSQYILSELDISQDDIDEKAKEMESEDTEDEEETEDEE